LTHPQPNLSEQNVLGDRVDDRVASRAQTLGEEGSAEAEAAATAAEAMPPTPPYIPPPRAAEAATAADAMVELSETQKHEDMDEVFEVMARWSKDVTDLEKARKVLEKAATMKWMALGCPQWKQLEKAWIAISAVEEFVKLKTVPRTITNVDAMELKVKMKHCLHEIDKALETNAAVRRASSRAMGGEYEPSMDLSGPLGPPVDMGPLQQYTAELFESWKHEDDLKKARSCHLCGEEKGCLNAACEEGRSNIEDIECNFKIANSKRFKWDMGSCQTCGNKAAVRLCDCTLSATHVCRYELCNDCECRGD